MRVVVTLSLLSLLLASCTTTTSSEVRERRPRRDNSEINRDPILRSPLYLERVTIDPQAVAAGSRLLFHEAAPGTNQGLRRRAQGYLSFTTEDACKTEVRVAEPLVGLDGRRAEQVYTVLSFYGTTNADRTRAHAVTASGSQQELRIEWLDERRVRLQAFIGDRGQAYVFEFRLRGLADRRVAFPYEVP